MKNLFDDVMGKCAPFVNGVDGGLEKGCQFAKAFKGGIFRINPFVDGRFKCLGGTFSGSFKCLVNLFSRDS